VETENPSVCATVNWTNVKISDGAVLNPTPGFNAPFSITRITSIPIKYKNYADPSQGIIPILKQSYANKTEHPTF
jgi:hypothetical protein